MKKHGWMIFMLAVLVLLLLTYTVTFTVSDWQAAIVSTFGKAGEPIDGSQPGRAGLHFKLPWPIQRVTKYDRRIFIFDDTYDEVSTADSLNVLVTVFCGWRIQYPDVFYRSLKTEAGAGDAAEAAEAKLRTIVRSKKGDVIGSEPLSALLNTDPGQMRIQEIEDQIRKAVQDEAGPRYGIQIVTLGIKSLGLPATVTKTVIESMKTERKRFAEAHRAQGRAEAEGIRERAKAAREQILAFADRKAKRIQAEGKQVAAELYKQYQEDPQFAMFLKELEFLRKTLKENTVIVGDEWLQHSLGFFRNGPSLIPMDGQGLTAPPSKEKTK